MKKILSILLLITFLLSVFAMPTNANAQESTSKNPVIKGYYADPDIDYFDHKYWIFPTTDGHTEGGWWSGTTFSAFSSEDMVNWKNEGVILDVKADTEEEAGLNENGVQIAHSSWSKGFAWAPSIEKIGDKYFFFYVGAIKDELMGKYAYWIEEENRYLDDKAIGVAVADNPTGPYVAYEEPLFYSKQVAEKVFEYNEKSNTEYTVPSVIDPSVFVDKGVDADRDGQDDIYISFGNWTPMLARVKVDGDKITIDDSVFKPIKGVLWGWWQPDDNGFMESIVIFKRNGKYYFTWSVAGTANIGYRVAYGTATKVTNTVQYKGTLLQLDKDNGIFGTGHQSVLCNPINNKVYICYHRLQNNADNPLIYNPENGDVGERGNFRETCIDEITFDSTGNAFSKPTHKGVDPVSVHNYKLISTVNATCTKSGKKTYQCTECKKTYSTTIKATGHNYNKSVVKPTCTKQGYTKYTCSKCKYSYKNSYVNATGHKYGTGKVTKAPTSSATGVMTYTCKTCGSKKTSSIAKLVKTSITKLTARSKGFTVTWNKVASASGYQIQYSTSNKFTNPKTVTVTGNSTTSKSITKLTAKKKYYVRVRTYKTINGTRYYSSWNGYKYITTKA